MIKNLIRRSQTCRLSEKVVPWMLLVVCILAYGVLIPWLGFYGDDWSYIWLLKTGSILPFFEHNRAILAPIYDVIGRILGLTPWPWHGLILIIRWICSICFWQLLRLLWPQNSRINAAAAFLFAVYPSFVLQSGAVTFWLVFAQFTVFLLSFIWGIQALRSQGWIRWLALAGSVAAETLNLVVSEYFFFLELLRPVFYAIAIHGEGIPPRKRWKSIALFCLPNCLVFAVDVFWRMSHQEQITGFYQLSLLAEFSRAPVATLGMLIRELANDLRVSLLFAWGHAALPPEFSGNNLGFRLAYGLFVGLIAIGLILFQTKLAGCFLAEKRRISLEMILLGMLVLILAGLPFRMAGLSLNEDYSTSRFSIPHLVGACLLLGGLIQLVPWPKFQIGFSSLLIALGIGLQLVVGNVYRMDWNIQRSLFEQFTMRMPDLEPGTVLVLNEDPVLSSEENALSGELNFIYTAKPTTGRVDYYLYFIPERVMNDFRTLQPGNPIRSAHLIGNFEGTTSQVIGVYVDPGHCLRVLDPILDAQNNRAGDLLRSIASLSTTQPILTGDKDRQVRLPEEVFGKEISPEWCRNFQQVDLYRQQGDWKRAAGLADQLSSYQPFSPDPVKVLAYVEPYAHQEKWEKASQGMQFVVGRSQNLDKISCLFLQRIDSTVPESPEKEDWLQNWLQSAHCPVADQN